MFVEHPGGGITEMECKDADFLGHEFLSMGKMKKDPRLYEVEEALITLHLVL